MAVSELVARDEFARLSVDWLSGVKELVFPDFDEAMVGGRVPYAAPPPRAGYWDSEPPTWLAAWIFVQRQPRYELGRSAKYSARSWQRLAGGLAEAHPYSTRLVFQMVDDSGLPAGWGASVEFSVHRQHDAPEFVRFQARVQEAIVPWRGATDFQLKWASFMRDWAMRVATCYGHITSGGDMLGTPEDGTPTQPWEAEENVSRCRDVLLGYSWVTVCPLD